MDLPKNENTFQFEYTAPVTKHKYEGFFTVICVLNIAQKHRLEIEKTRLMADYQNPTDGLFGLATILANLRLRIIKAPEWWKQSEGGFLIEDEEALVALYDKVMLAETEWKRKVIEEGEKMQKESPPTSETAS